MSRNPLFERKTALAYKTREKTVVRGYNLSDLAEEGYSFSDAMFVLFQGRIPTQAEEKMLTYEMGSFLEHSHVAFGGFRHRRHRRAPQPAHRRWRRA